MSGCSHGVGMQRRASPQHRGAAVASGSGRGGDLRYRSQRLKSIQAYLTAEYVYTVPCKFEDKIHDIEALIVKRIERELCLRMRLRALQDGNHNDLPPQATAGLMLRDGATVYVVADTASITPLPTKLSLERKDNVSADAGEAAARVKRAFRAVFGLRERYQLPGSVKTLLRASENWPGMHSEAYANHVRVILTRIRSMAAEIDFLAHGDRTGSRTFSRQMRQHLDALQHSIVFFPECGATLWADLARGADGINNSKQQHNTRSAIFETNHSKKRLKEYLGSFADVPKAGSSSR